MLRALALYSLFSLEVSQEHLTYPNHFYTIQDTLPMQGVPGTLPILLALWGLNNLYMKCLGEEEPLYFRIFT